MTDCVKDNPYNYEKKGEKKQEIEIINIEWLGI